MVCAPIVRGGWLVCNLGPEWHSCVSTLISRECDVLVFSKFEQANGQKQPGHTYET